MDGVCSTDLRDEESCKILPRKYEETAWKT